MPQPDSGLPDAGGPLEQDAGHSADAGHGDGNPFPRREIPPAPPLRSLIAEIGPLGAPDANGVRLPEGFRSRILARTGDVVPSTSHLWHIAPDGGGAYGTEDGGWIYVSNAEFVLVGGVGALRFNGRGELVDAYPILEGTNLNCAGGKTPWHTWLSCEEANRGRVFECDPWGEHPAVERPALGVFKHEAAAVDPIRAHVYLTEDEEDGRFYRFVPERLTPEGHPDLSSGGLEVATVTDGAVRWSPVPDPRYTERTPTRRQVPGSTAFNGSEGIWFQDDRIYFSTKGDQRIWVYDVVGSTIRVLYDGQALEDPPLWGVDNITVSCCGDVLVAEDGGSMQVVAILPSGQAKPLLQVVGQDESEITGPAFDPSGTRLYFSSQRGPDGRGLTYEVTGPFHAPA